MPRYSAQPAPAPHQPGRVLRAVALTAVSIGVLVLAAAAFVLSYSGLHAIAQQAGISAPLARGYPVILDAMLVISCAAVLSLRGAGAVSKFYAWLSLLVLLAATAGADALHSTGTAVPHRTAAFAAAVLPWILLLIGFGLLLAMLRHFRLHRFAPPAVAAGLPPPQEDRRPAALPPGPTQSAGPPQLAAAAPAPPVPAPPVPAPPVPVPGPPVPAPQAVPAERPDLPEQQPTAAGVPPAPGPDGGPPLAVPEQPSRDQREPAANGADGAPPSPSRPPQPRAAPAEPDLAEPDLAYLDHDDLDPGSDGPGGDDPGRDDLGGVGPGRDEDPGNAGPDDREAVVPEEIFAAPPAEDDLRADDPAGRPLTPQPAFHRMWSSPTPPGDEDED